MGIYFYLTAIDNYIHTNKDVIVSLKAISKDAADYEKRKKIVSGTASVAGIVSGVCTVAALFFPPAGIFAVAAVAAGVVAGGTTTGVAIGDEVKSKQLQKDIETQQKLHYYSVTILHQQRDRLRPLVDQLQRQHGLDIYAALMSTLACLAQNILQIKSVQLGGSPVTAANTVLMAIQDGRVNQILAASGLHVNQKRQLMTTVQSGQGISPVFENLEAGAPESNFRSKSMEKVGGIVGGGLGAVFSVADLVLVIQHWKDSHPLETVLEQLVEKLTQSCQDWGEARRLLCLFQEKKNFLPPTPVMAPAPVASGGMCYGPPSNPIGQPSWLDQMTQLFPQTWGPVNNFSVNHNTPVCGNCGRHCGRFQCSKWW